MYTKFYKYLLYLLHQAYFTFNQRLIPGDTQRRQQREIGLTHQDRVRKLDAEVLVVIWRMLEKIRWRNPVNHETMKTGLTETWCRWRRCFLTGYKSARGEETDEEARWSTQSIVAWPRLGRLSMVVNVLDFHSRNWQIIDSSFQPVHCPYQSAVPVRKYLDCHVTYYQ
jgi:hypothetical protein